MTSNNIPKRSTFQGDLQRYGSPELGSTKLYDTGIDPNVSSYQLAAGNAGSSRLADTAYLDYAPNAREVGLKYANFLDRLGFQCEVRCKKQRNNFIDALQCFTKEPEKMYLRPSDNEAAFAAMVADFLRAYGTTYWGPTEREHLDVLEPSRGFLCPRDSQRRGSRLVEVLGELFQYKAKVARGNDAVRPFDKQIARRIDFTNLGKRTRMTGVRSMSNAELFAVTNTQLHQSTHADTRDQDREDDVFDGIRIRPAKRITRYIDGDDSDTPMIESRKRTARRARVRRYQKNKRLRLRGKVSDESLQYALSEYGFTTSVDSLTNNRTFNLTPNIESLVEEDNSENHPPSTKIKLRISTRPFEDAQDTSAVGSISAPIVFTPSSTLTESSGHVIDLTGIEPASTGDSGIKIEAFSAAIMDATVFKVTASNQATMAPVTVELSSCKSFAVFFEIMITECGLECSMIEKVSAISATYTWNGEKHRIRKDRAKDWTIFCRELRKAWDRNPKQFDDGCKIEILIHVDE